ncbi:MAG: hemolysin family protein [Pseudolabrys sp.]|nr:hemolysin family protein [Pseudolabrys sp.]MDP2294045.1 hemolysin family protein [Pseudolabrys sp.]
MLYLEVAIVAVLIVINGLLAMSELAIVSSRPSRLKAMIDRNVYGSRRALALASNPGRFLSTVQIGITLVGIVSGAVSGATLGLRLTGSLIDLGLPRAIAEPAGIGVVVALITYASLIVGELVPKQIALRNPERVAASVAPAMTLLATVAAPVVWLLDFSGRALLRLLRQNTPSASGVSDEEIKTIIAEAETAGIIEPGERKLISGVMRLSDRSVSGVMTPRTEVDWLDLTASDKAIRDKLKNAQHSRLPAGDTVDDLIGVVQTRDLLAAALSRKPLDIRSHIRQAPVVHDTADALDVLETLRAAEVPMALVHDEYGHFEGIITPADMLEAIAGAFRADVDTDEPEASRRADGSWLLSGSLAADEMAEHLAMTLPARRDYATVAGFVLAGMGHLPACGETFTAHGWRFEVVDLDGRRIDKVLAARLPAIARGRSARV